MLLPRRLGANLVPLAIGALLLIACPPALASDPDPVGAWPLQPEPEVVRGFDPPDIVWAPGHRGVDLHGTPGQAVRAALPGSVTFAGMLAGRGVVVVGHGDTRTTYEPVSASVVVGTVVPQGAVIGSLALAGSHCLPRACLHWGWLRGETYLDPLGLIGAGPVRLLPLWRDEKVGRRSSPTVTSWPALSWLNPYADVLMRLAELARSPPGWPSARPGSVGLPPFRGQARGCACS
jgi:murein DD-endopeptidase MepM/ murein hydrolase activator NlpD